MGQLFCVKDKVVVITGALGSIGQAYAKAFIERGAQVILLDKEETGYGTFGQEVASFEGQMSFMKMDVTNVEEIKQTVTTIVAIYGKIDVLLNHAGLNMRKPAFEVAEEDWDRVLDVNLKGVFFMAREVGKQMVKQGYGKIINTASVSSVRGHNDLVAYAASKGGVVQMTKVLAHEWAPYNVQVNAIGPGYIQTKQTELFLKDEKTYEEILTKIPMKRVGTPEDLIGGCLFLATSASDYVTGHTLFIEGGRLID